MSLIYDKETIAERIRTELLAFDLRTVCENISEIYLKNENIPELLESRQGTNKINKCIKDYINKRLDGITKELTTTNLLELKQNLGFEITKNNVTSSTIARLEQDLKDSLANAVIVAFGDRARSILLPSVSLDRAIYLLALISTDSDMHYEIHDRLRIKTYNEDRSFNTIIQKSIQNKRVGDIVSKQREQSKDIQIKCFDSCINKIGLTKLDNFKVKLFLDICSNQLGDISGTEIYENHILGEDWLLYRIEKLNTKDKNFSIYGMTLEEDNKYFKSIGVFLINKEITNLYLRNSYDIKKDPSEWELSSHLAFFKVTILRTGKLTYRVDEDKSDFLHSESGSYSLSRSIADIESISTYGSLEESAKAYKQELDNIINYSRKNYKCLNENARWLSQTEIENLIDKAINKHRILKDGRYTYANLATSSTTINRELNNVIEEISKRTNTYIQFWGNDEDKLIYDIAIGRSSIVIKSKDNSYNDKANLKIYMLKSDGTEMFEKVESDNMYSFIENAVTLINLAKKHFALDCRTCLEIIAEKIKKKTGLNWEYIGEDNGSLTIDFEPNVSYMKNLGGKGLQFTLDLGNNRIVNIVETGKGISEVFIQRVVEECTKNKCIKTARNVTKNEVTSVTSSNTYKIECKTSEISNDTILKQVIELANQNKSGLVPVYRNSLWEVYLVYRGINNRTFLVKHLVKENNSKVVKESEMLVDWKTNRYKCDFEVTKAVLNKTISVFKLLNEHKL